MSIHQHERASRMQRIEQDLTDLRMHRLEQDLAELRTLPSEAEVDDGLEPGQREEHGHTYPSRAMQQRIDRALRSVDPRVTPAQVVMRYRRARLALAGP